MLDPALIPRIGAPAYALCSVILARAGAEGAAISLEALQAATGMSRNTVRAAIRAAVAAGVLRTWAAQRARMYALEGGSIFDPMALPTTATKGQNLTPTDAPGIDGRGIVAPNVPVAEGGSKIDPRAAAQYIYIHDHDHDHVVPDAPAQSAPGENTPPPSRRKRSAGAKSEPKSPAAVRAMLARVCSIDLAGTATATQVIRVNKTAAALWAAATAAGQSEADTVSGIQYVASYCKRSVHPFNAGQPLTPEAIQARWQAAHDARPAASAPPPAQPPVDRAAAVAAAAAAARAIRETGMRH